MQRIRLWTAGLLSRVDWMVAQVENHEAIAQSAIREVQQSAARAKVQLARVRRDGEALREQLAEAQEATATWRERARRIAGEDEDSAVECLRRSKAAERRAARLARRAAEHDRVEGQLARDVQAVDQRLGGLKEQRNLLRTRQARAEALSSVARANQPLGAEVGEVFERWETRVTERELEGECAVSDEADEFEAGFSGEEERQALRAELSELLHEEDAR